MEWERAAQALFDFSAYRGLKLMSGEKDITSTYAVIGPVADGYREIGGCPGPGPFVFMLIGER